TAIPIAVSKTSCRGDSAKRQASLNRVAAKRLHMRVGVTASSYTRQQGTMPAPHAAGIKKMDAEARTLTRAVGSEAAVAEFKTIAIFCGLGPLLFLSA
ncbi:hypothetical protein ABID58_007508, partial [Bradyrhizobium sp. S3.2.6]|uniref:hypothetical protein n=1 Tax=Bradyrhizobium sp. S3.2.6 TaxID=3156428 RepID=UPI003395EB83